MAFTSSGSGAGGGPFKAEINITPMIDILLVLLIMFIVVVVMSDKKGLDTQIPQPTTEKSPPQPERTIVIQIAWKGEDQQPALKINEEDVTWDKLHDRLSRIFEQRMERVAFVKGDEDLDFQYVADAIDIARSSGVSKVGLLSKTTPTMP